MVAPLIQVQLFHFVLVHGSCHGAWCWYKVEALLTSAGHQVSSLDMATSGIEPRQVGDLQSISDYFEPLKTFMGSLPKDERVVLVGHSFAGEGISWAMEMFPQKIFAAVFIAASMPGPRLSLSDIGKQSGKGRGSEMDNQFGYDQGPDKPPTSFNFGPKFLARNVYQHCSHQDITLATRLVRPVQLQFPKEDKLVLSKEKYGSVNRAFVVSEDDNLAKPDFQRWMIRNNPPGKVKVVRGADHMVMISKPHQLYVCLLEIAEYFS